MHVCYQKWWSGPWHHGVCTYVRFYTTCMFSPDGILYVFPRFNFRHIFSMSQEPALLPSFVARSPKECSDVLVTVLSTYVRIYISHGLSFVVCSGGWISVVLCCVCLLCHCPVLSLVFLSSLLLDIYPSGRPTTAPARPGLDNWPFIVYEKRAPVDLIGEVLLKFERFKLDSNYARNENKYEGKSVLLKFEVDKNCSMIILRTFGIWTPLCLSLEPSFIYYVEQRKDLVVAVRSSTVVLFYTTAITSLFYQLTRQVRYLF